MINEQLKAKGELHLVLTDEFGNIKQEQTTKNMIVTAGLGFITSRLKDALSGVMSHMGVGDSSTAAATGQTDLQAATNKVRVALTSTTQVTTTVTNDGIQFVATFGAGTGTFGITEAGIFNAASAGTMLARTVFSVINKGANDTLTITWKITFASA